MQEIVSHNKKEYTSILYPPPAYQEIKDFREYDNDGKYRYYGVINESIDRRQRLFVTEYWDEKYSQLKWKGSDVPKYNSVLILNIPYDKSYCHNMLDTLPLVFNLELKSHYDLIIIPNTNFLEKFYLELNLILKKTMILKTHTSFQAKNVRTENYCIKARNVKNLIEFKSFVEAYKNKTKIHLSKNQNKFIYCTRNSGGGALNDRRMDDLNEDELISLSEKYCKENNLEFFYFNGKDASGKRNLRITEQMGLFHDAKIVVGPHGGALSNLIFLDPKNKCKVAEFVSGEMSKGVHGVKPYVKNYNRLYCNIIDEFCDYYFIPFSKGSTNMTTQIDPEDFKLFLKKI